MKNARQSSITHKCETVCEVCENRAENPICSSLDLSDIAIIKQTVTVSAGDCIFRMGEIPKGVYSIRKGLIKLESYARSGAAHTLRLFGPGAAFGYRSVFSNEPSTASALAMEDSEICLLPREPTLALSKKNPQILFNLVQQLSEDLKGSEKKWMHQMDLGATERIAESLVFLSEKFANTTWTRRDIAQWAGTTPETVIRTLAQFEKEELIDQTQGRNIVIKNSQALKQYFS